MVTNEAVEFLGGIQVQWWGAIQLPQEEAFSLWVPTPSRASASCLQSGQGGVNLKMQINRGSGGRWGITSSREGKLGHC